MNKINILVVLLLFVGLGTQAQEITSSPYSFFGIGLQKFKGTTENRSMGGIGILSDSIHLNLQNPASYGNLELTTYTLGASHTSIDVQENSVSDKTSSTNIDYVALGVPAGKFGFGFGLVPYTGVGYKLRKVTDESLNEYTGKGGVNKLFLSLGYTVSKNLRVGVEGNYNFGSIENRSLLFQDQIQYGTLERNESDLGGFGVNFGVQYDDYVSDNLKVKASANYSPSSILTSENTRSIALVRGRGQELRVRNVNPADTDFELPEQYRIGVGIGEPQKWFAGLEYQSISSGNYNNRSFQVADLEFKDAQTYRVGGFYLPDFDDVTSYFNRMTYRLGARFQENGMTIRNEDIEEFGISFGLGLPAGPYLSNINLGVEYGQRGTTNSGLVQEDFLSLFISVSFNDVWFRERKFK
jgi:long-subunit fatty acid transport protein